MSAIITEKFRRHNARNFFESFSEASADVYYLFLGKAHHSQQEQLEEVILHLPHQQTVYPESFIIGTQC